MILKNGKVVTDKGIVQQDLVIEGDSVRTGGGVGEAIDLKGKYVLPGFVEFHFHGYQLFDFTQGRYDPATNTFDRSEVAYRAGFDMLRQTYPRFGTTGFYIGSGAATVEHLNSSYQMLHDYLTQDAKGVSGSRILGSLNEGSFINPEMAGAQNPDNIMAVTRQAYDRLEDFGCIKLVNVVPDFGEPAVELTRYLTEKGVIVGAGHTKATYHQFAAAIEAGLRYCIHFTNGPTGSSFKPFDGGGAVEAVLHHDEVYAELIMDGYHVNPIYVREIIRRKGVDRIIAVTDCVYAGGSDLKEFEEDGVKACVSENGEYIALAGSTTNALAGSNLTPDRGFRNTINWLTQSMKGFWTRELEAYSLDDAVAAASRMYSTNPNVLTGRDKEGFGELKDGAKADLCVIDINGSPGAYQTAVAMTMVGGEIVYEK